MSSKTSVSDGSKSVRGEGKRLETEIVYGILLQDLHNVSNITARQLLSTMKKNNDDCRRSDEHLDEYVNCLEKMQMKSLPTVLTVA